MAAKATLADLKKMEMDYRRFSTTDMLPEESSSIWNEICGDGSKLEKCIKSRSNLGYQRYHYRAVITSQLKSSVKKCFSENCNF